MPSEYKGYPEFTNEIFTALWGCNFFEWKLDRSDSLEPGQVCEAVINYNNDRSFFLELIQYDSSCELNSTWKVTNLTTRLPVRDQRVQAFQLETNEHFILRRAKLRPVILLKKHEDNFGNPLNVQDTYIYWEALPLFTYKDNKHSIDYVQNDQRLLSPMRFYIPPSSEIQYRLIKESAARFNLIQPIAENNLKVITSLNPEVGMQKAFKLSKPALKLLLYHYFKSSNTLLNIYDRISDLNTEYDIYKEAISDLYNTNIKT